MQEEESRKQEAGSRKQEAGSGRGTGVEAWRGREGSGVYHVSTDVQLRGVWYLTVQCSCWVVGGVGWFIVLLCLRCVFGGVWDVPSPAGVSSGVGKSGPTPFTICTSIPSACGITRISEKMIAASKGNLPLHTRAVWSVCLACVSLQVGTHPVPIEDSTAGRGGMYVRARVRARVWLWLWLCACVCVWRGVPYPAFS